MLAPQSPTDFMWAMTIDGPIKRKITALQDQLLENDLIACEVYIEKILQLYLNLEKKIERLDEIEEKRLVEFCIKRKEQLQEQQLKYQKAEIQRQSQSNPKINDDLNLNSAIKDLDEVIGGLQSTIADNIVQLKEATVAFQKTAQAIDQHQQNNFNRIKTKLVLGKTPKTHEKNLALIEKSMQNKPTTEKVIAITRGENVTAENLATIESLRAIFAPGRNPLMMAKLLEANTANNLSTTSLETLKPLVMKCNQFYQDKAMIEKEKAENEVKLFSAQHQKKKLMKEQELRQENGSKQKYKTPKLKPPYTGG